MTQRLAVGLLALTAVVCAQRRVDPGNTYSRVICVVPLVGTGTQADPKRPMYAPWPPLPPTSRTAILSYTQQVSDDGRYALVEFVAQDRAAFAAILNDKQIKAFEKGKAKKEDIEQELKKYKKDFAIDKFGAVQP